MALYLNGKKVINSLVADGHVGVIIDSVIPRMTSDTTPKGKCSASYVHSGRYAYYGFTTPSNGNVGNARDFWYYGGNSSANNWIEYEFNRPSTILYVSFGTIQDGIGKHVKIQYSDDDTNWIDADTITIATNEYSTYELSSPVYCKYIRIFIVDNGMTVISGINAFGCEGKADIMPRVEPLYTLNQSQGGAWIDTGIAVADIDEFTFVSSVDGVFKIASTIPTSSIPVKTGSSDVYLVVFTSGQAGKEFNIRVYNGNLYVSYNQAGSSDSAIDIYDGRLCIEVSMG